MTKELIIIALGLALLYLYYQNRKLKGLPTTNSQLVIHQVQTIERLKTEQDQIKNQYHQQGKLLDAEQLANNQLTEQISQLKKQIVELTKSDWATNRLAELEANLRTKEARIQDLEKQVRRLKKK